MLIYANYLELDGEDAYKSVFFSLCGWLKKKTNKSIKPTELMSSNKFNFDNVWVSTEAASREEPHLYAVTIKHPDISVRGRQWIVEVGILSSNEKTAVSVVLKTDEMSSLVTSGVFATRPLLVKYIAENSQLSSNTVGTSYKNLEDDTDAYRGLLYEIEKIDREYPIVLVSPKRDGEYPVDISLLQEQLVGLAQVVKVSLDCNSYEMAEVLSQQYSSWNGAINIIYTPLKNGYIRTKLFQSNYIDHNFDAHKDIVSFLLSTVTHNTNVPKIRRQIRSEGVKAKSLKERFLSRINNSESASTEDIEEILEIAASQETEFRADIDRIELEKLQLEDDKDILEKKLAAANWSVDSLKRQLQGAGYSSNNIDVEELLAFTCRVDDPTPSECLTIISSALGDKIVFLDSATVGAKDSTSFKRGRILLDMLRRLIIDYLPLYLEGGDNRARAVFTNKQYAANESETVVNNTELAKTRKFMYKGKSVAMWQHLKVGIADSPEHTIRVHFLVDSDDQKIVVGYCGEHLPLPGR